MASDAAELDLVARSLSSLELDRDSPVPLYYQLSEHLAQAITGGALPPGTQFANEIDLAHDLGVSRPTMRQAMDQLVSQGLIVRRRGVGTRVVQPRVRRPLELTSLYDDLQRSGERPTTEVIHCEVVAADGEPAERLRVVAGTPVLHLVRLRSARDTPIALMTNFVPAERAPFAAEALLTHGLYELMRSSGTTLHSATQTVGARTASASEALMLQESRGAALLTMQRETLDDTGAVVEFATHLYVASRYSFEIHLVHH